MMRWVTKLLLFVIFSSAVGQSPELEAWIIADGTEAVYYEEGSSIPQTLGGTANVKYVKYDDDNVYINTSGLPAYIVGPFPDGNPALPGDIDYLFQIPRKPVENTGTKTETSLGQIGVWINGVPIYNPLDAMSYNNQGIWNRDAQLNEADGFDCNRGHPSPNMSDLNNSYYHHHQIPIKFSESPSPISSVCETYPTEALFTLNAAEHSPLIGYSFDGYPVYGPYGYSNPNDVGSSIRLIKSSYKLRNITARTSLPDGTILSPSQYGPSPSDADYPLGTYIEDYEYDATNGDLDEYNGRWCVTPEYPSGTYAYFATVDDTFNSAYPYSIGPSYYGVVASENFPSSGNAGETSVIVPSAGITTYAEYVSASTDITNVSPNNVDEGTTTVVLTFSFNESLTGPASNNNAVPDDVMLAGVAGTSVNRDNSTGEVTATFDVSTLSAGAYDIVATFNPPMGEAVIYTGTWVFTINNISSEINIVGVSPTQAEEGTKNVVMTFSFEGGTSGPTTNFNRAPDQITLGGISGTSVSRNSTSGEVSVSFDVSSLTDGFYDLVATFNLPSDDKVFSSTDVFEIIPATITTSGEHYFEAWKYNKVGEIYTNTNNEDILVNVGHVHYDDDYVYVTSSGIPDYYEDGETHFDGADQAWVHTIPLLPEEETGAKTEASVKLGLFIDGTVALGPEDGQSYNDGDIWNQLAYEFEGLDFDGTNGHSTAKNVYHHHVAHKGLYDFDGAEHSPIVGYAFDGYPIYGPFGYTNATDAGSGIARMESSYGTRSISDRTTLPDGTVLTADQYGPSLAEQPLGKYVEDYEYTGFGDLDEYNGRWCVTPEYPEGTYAYFLTVDAANAPVYPYILGEEFYGVVETSNFGPSGGSATIPGTAVEYIAILADPANVTANAGEKASFTITCTGTPDAIQWYVSTDGGSTWEAILEADAAYTGESSETLEIASVEASMYGNLYKTEISGTNALEESMEAELISQITAIDDDLNVEAVKVYPSPFSNELTIQAPSDALFYVYDLAGRLVYSGYNPEKLGAEWKSGIYLIEVVGEGFSDTMKVMKR